MLLLQEATRRFSSMKKRPPTPSKMLEDLIRDG
jgi:hypothetical protein